MLDEAGQGLAAAAVEVRAGLADFERDGERERAPAGDEVEEPAEKDLFTIGTRAVWVAEAHELTRVDFATLRPASIRVRGRVLAIAAGHTQGVPRKTIWALAAPRSS